MLVLNAILISPIHDQHGGAARSGERRNLTSSILLYSRLGADQSIEANVLAFAKPADGQVPYSWKR